MSKKYALIFDKVIIKQLHKAAKNQQVQKILAKMLDKLEDQGPRSGKLLDAQNALYEIKNLRPPIRLYFKVKEEDIYVFEYRMKTQPKSQQKSIDQLKKK